MSESCGAAEQALAQLVHRTARLLDDRDFDAYLRLFAEGAVYRIEVNAPELAEPMIWMEMTPAELRQRFDSIHRHEWRIVQPEQTRMVSVDSTSVGTGSAHTSSTFVIYGTDTEGRSSCYAVGRYEDDWSLAHGGWLLRARTVSLKTRLLSVPTPVPL